MTTRTAIRHEHRPAPVLSLLVLLGFLGFSAMAGGVALTFGGSRPPQHWLDRIPVVDTWVVPGLVLGIGFGLGSLVVAYGMLRRPPWPVLGAVERVTGYHWAWAGTVLLGVGHVAWIVVELAYLPELSVLQAVYGAVGVALATMPMLPAVRRYLR